MSFQTKFQQKMQHFLEYLNYKLIIHVWENHFSHPIIPPFFKSWIVTFLSLNVWNHPGLDDPWHRTDFDMRSLVAMFKDMVMRLDTFTISGNQTATFLGSGLATCYQRPPNGAGCPNLGEPGPQRDTNCHKL